MDPVIRFIQLGSTHFKDNATLAPKLADPPSWWKSLTPPPLNLDPVYQSGLTHILYYLKMFVIEIQLLRNHGQTLANRTKPGLSLEVAVFVLSTHGSVKQYSPA